MEVLDNTSRNQIKLERLQCIPPVRLNPINRYSDGTTISSSLWLNQIKSDEHIVGYNVAQAHTLRLWLIETYYIRLFGY